jgi:hypothetical protein
LPSRPVSAFVSFPFTYLKFGLQTALSYSPTPDCIRAMFQHFRFAAPRCVQIISAAVLLLLSALTNIVFDTEFTKAKEKTCAYPD